MNNINMTVKDLKEIIKDVPDDYPVIVPVVDEYNSNNILAYRYARTAGILENQYIDNQDKTVFCLNTANFDGANISDQVKSTDAICIKVLF